MAILGKRAQLIVLLTVSAALATYLLPTEILLAYAIPGNGNGYNGDNNGKNCETGLENGEGYKYGLKKNCDD